MKLRWAGKSDESILDLPTDVYDLSLKSMRTYSESPIKNVWAICGIYDVRLYSEGEPLSLPVLKNELHVGKEQKLWCIQSHKPKMGIEFLSDSY